MAEDLLVLLALTAMAISSVAQQQHSALVICLFALFGVALVLRNRRERERLLFINQLKSHRSELRDGATVMVDNQVLRYGTLLTTYELNIGFLLAEISIPSRYRLANVEIHRESLLYSFVSLISGWWSFPHGPLHNLHTVLQNIRGGKQTSVALLVDGEVLARAQAAAPFDPYAKEDKPVIEARAFTGEGSRSNRLLEAAYRNNKPKETRANPSLASFEQRLQERAAARRKKLAQFAAGAAQRVRQHIEGDRSKAAPSSNPDSSPAKQAIGDAAPSPPRPKKLSSLK